MTIERISFPDGMQIQSAQPAELNRFISKLKDKYRKSAVHMEPGEYDLTHPQGMFPYKYSLLVLDNGTGVLRSIAPTRTSFSVGGSSKELSSATDKPAIVAGPKADGTGPYIFEIISFAEQA